jgi:hypothetical protein
MNTFRFTAFRRRRGSRTSLLIKGEVTEDAYARGPFLKFRADPQPFARSFELCFHQGWPEGDPTTGRMVTFEHVEPDFPDTVYLLRIHLAHGENVEIESRTTKPKGFYDRPPKW